MSESAWEAYSSNGDVGLNDYMKSNGTLSYQKGDYVQVFLDRLRSIAVDFDVQDIMLLELALRLGSIDSIGTPRAQGKYTQRIEGRSLYRKPEQVNDGQLRNMIGKISLELNSQKIAPGTPIGAISATSISEPIYQAGMRTFHYAGVLTKDVDVLDVLNKQVSNTPDPKNSELVLALNSELRFDKPAVFSLASKLERKRLNEYTHFTKYDPIYHEALVNDQVAIIDQEIDEYLGGSEFDVQYEVTEGGKKVLRTKKNLPLHQVWQYNRSFYDKVISERDAKMYLDDSTYTPQYQELLDKKKKVQKVFLDAILEAGRGSSYLIYLYDKEADDGKQRSFQKDWSQILDKDLLKAIVRRQIKASDGRFRQVKAFPGLFENAKVNETEVMVNGAARPGVILTFPFLSSRLDMSLQGILPNLEFCNGCKAPVTLAKLVNKKSKADKKVFEDESWDTATPIDAYTMEIVQQTLRDAGVLTNPESMSDTTGLVEVDMTESGYFDFEIAELNKTFRRCSKCGGGWFNVAITPKKIDFDNTESKPENIAAFSDLTKSSVGSDNLAPNAGDMPATAYADMVRYPGFSAQGQHHDYPLHTMHSGKLPCDPEPNEWFLHIMVDDFKDGRNDTFRGHLETAQQADFADFNRCNSNNLREVELVLGIEAARFTLAHEMAAGQDSTMSYKHYMLLADTMTNGVSIKTASAGSSSVRGVASEKGNRTVTKHIPDDTPDEIIIEALAAQGQSAPLDSSGKLMNKQSAIIKLELATAENYGSVLAQAYERQSQVVLRRAVQGLSDDLTAPNSAQIVGIPVRSGTQGGATKGKYGTPNLESIIELIDLYLTTGDIIHMNRLETIMKGRVPTQILQLLKGEYSGISRAMDGMAMEASGSLWWPQGEEDGIGDLSQMLFDLKRKKKIGLPTIGLEEKIKAHENLLEETEFSELMNRYVILSKSLEIIRRIYGLDQ